MEAREEFLVLAFEVALQGVESGAGGPFGAVIVRGDEVADVDRLQEGHPIGGRGDHAAVAVAYRGEPRYLVDEFHDHAAVHEAGRVGIGRTHPVHEHAARIGDGARFHAALR